MGKLFDFFSRNNQEEEDADRAQMERARADLARRMEQYGDGNTLDPEKARTFLLHVALHGTLETEDIVEDDHLYLPRWDITIQPSISQLTQRGVVLDFYLSAPQWGKQLYECCAGMGDNPGQAQAMATGSFAYSFLSGILRMERREHGIPLTTSFAGREHRWQAYISDMVNMGTANRRQGDPGEVYWELLKDDLLKRLGNQRLCYVKVYGAKVNGEVTGECRVDDVKSEELSAKVARLVSQWDVDGFASQKQFFFFRQEEDTTLPARYLGAEGRAELKEKVIQAVRMFHASWGKDDFDTLPARMAQAFDDPTLATECIRFLPEICAENAFREQITAPETIQLARAGQTSLDNVFYKNQLADYYPIVSSLFEAFNEGVFGEEINDVYRELIRYSATYSAIAQAREKESSLKGGRIAVLFPVEEDFEIR